MKLYTLFALPLILCLFSYGQSCTNVPFNDSRNNRSDTTNHTSGDHHNNITVTHACNYTSSGTANCNVSCQVSVTQDAGESADSKLNSIFNQHDVKKQTNVGTANASNLPAGSSVKCGGTAAASAVECAVIFGGCNGTVTIKAGSDGLNATITYPPNNVFQDSFSDSTTCNSVPDNQVATIIGGDGGVCEQFFGDGNGPAPLQTCGDTSPIIIDTEGEGFRLTSAANGVLFDIRGDGHPVQIAWTAPGSHNAFLALDRNGDGKVSSGKELFGNFTPQPSSNHPNGFLALKE